MFRRNSGRDGADVEGCDSVPVPHSTSRRKVGGFIDKGQEVTGLELSAKVVMALRVDKDLTFPGSYHSYHFLSNVFNVAENVIFSGLRGHVTNFDPIHEEEFSFHAPFCTDFQLYRWSVTGRAFNAL